MTRLRTPRSVVCAVVVAVLATLAAPLSATVAATQSEYDAVQQRLRETRRLVAETEARQRQVRRDISSAQSQRREIVSALEEINADLRSAQSRVGSAETELARVQQQLLAKTQELDAALAALQEAYDTVRDRAIQVYKSGPASFVDFLLGAEDFGDLISRAQVLGYVFASDDARIRWIRETRERLVLERQEIEALRELAAAQVALVQAERDRVASLRRSADSRRQQLDGQIQQQYASLEELNRARDAYVRQQRELEAASQRIGSMLRGRTGGTASARRGEMVWPTSGPITSGYGWRTHPVYGTRRFHAGIDIGAPTGRPVVAAASGTVVSAGWNGGYGNAVVVDHGGGLATVYAHLSSFSASSGATLSQGQQLGRVGCTGTCTGPHLHFEVRVNGDPQNPLNWLP